MFILQSSTLLIVEGKKQITHKNQISNRMADFTTPDAATPWQATRLTLSPLLNGGYLQMLETAYERLRTLKADGKTAQEAIEMKPLADLEREWGDRIFTGDKWIEII
jgi:hypothetical protein